MEIVERRTHTTSGRKEKKMKRKWKENDSVEDDGNDAGGSDTITMSKRRKNIKWKFQLNDRTNIHQCKKIVKWCWRMTTVEMKFSRRHFFFFLCRLHLCHVIDRRKRTEKIHRKIDAVEWTDEVESIHSFFCRFQFTWIRICSSFEPQFFFFIHFRIEFHTHFPFWLIEYRMNFWRTTIQKKWTENGNIAICYRSTLCALVVHKVSLMFYPLHGKKRQFIFTCRFESIDNFILFAFRLRFFISFSCVAMQLQPLTEITTLSVDMTKNQFQKRREIDLMLTEASVANRNYTLVVCERNLKCDSWCRHREITRTPTHMRH